MCVLHYPSVQVVLDDAMTFLLLDSTATKDVVQQASSTRYNMAELGIIYGPIQATELRFCTCSYDVDGPLFIATNGDHIPISKQGLKCSKLLKQMDAEDDAVNPDRRYQVPFSSDLLSLYSELCEAKSSSCKGVWKSQLQHAGLHCSGLSNREMFALCHAMAVCSRYVSFSMPATLPNFLPTN